MDRRTPFSLESYGLVADVGGTNIRLGVVDLGGVMSPRVAAARSFSVSAYGGIAEAARDYLRGLEVSHPPASAVFAVAGPINDGAIALTNSAWHSSAAQLRSALDVGRVRLINDYEAIALAVPYLKASDCVAIGPVRASSDPSDGATVAIVGPGTGLGVAGLLRRGGTVTPLVTEGGHIGFAPADEVEIAILRLLTRRFGRVSAERLVSGPGLRNLHDALGEIEGAPAASLTAEEITRTARADPKSLCARVFARFCAIFGAMAGDVALTMGARGGVLVAGGILPANADLFAQSAFRARFEAKGRMAAYMQRIPTRLIVETHAGLIGAASLLVADETARG